MSVFGRTKSRPRDAAPLRPAPVATPARPTARGGSNGAPLPVPPAPNAEPPVGPVRHGDEQTLLALADGNYVLSTPDGLVAECGAGIATQLGITSENAVDQDALALLDSGGDSDSRASLQSLLSDGGGHGSAGPAADGRHAGLELLVIPVALSYGWEFTALLTELGTREPDSWDVEDLRVQHDRAIEAIAAVREGDDAGDAPVGRLAGILIVVRPSSGPELSRDEVQARAAERFAEADAAAAAARAAATNQYEDPADVAGAAGNASMSGLEELLDRARDLRERLEASEQMVADATRSHEEVVGQLAQVREEREIEAQRRADAEAEAARAHAEREEALRAVHSETAAQAEHAGAELEQARAMADQARAEVEAARDTLEQELTAARESAAAELAETRSALDSELRAAHETIASLRADLDAAGAEVDAARAGAGPGSEALAAAEARIGQAEEALRVAEQDATEARAEADLARADIEMRRAELLTARDEADATREELLAARDEADATRDELLAARDQIDAARRETEAARVEADAARVEADEARAAANVAVGARDDILEQLVAMTAERDELQATADALSGQADVASRLMHALRAEFSMPGAAAPASAAPPASAPATAAESRPEPGSGAKLLGGRRARAESELPPVESIAGHATGYVGLTGSFERVDEAFSKMLGYTEEELRSARWPSSIDRENLEAHRKIAEDLKSGRVDTADVDTVYMHGQGLLVPVVGTISLARTEAGEPCHFVFRVPVSAAR